MSANLKEKLHPRNKHRFPYNFSELITVCPELSAFVSLNQYQQLSIDFKNPEAVKALNKALLNFFYGIKLWDIPKRYLCPPIPGRADYIHYIADLLAFGYETTVPWGKKVKVLDIGVGANCIYPLIGSYEYGWSFVGAEIDAVAIRSAKNIVNANSLSNLITIRKQNSPRNIFNGLIEPGERFDLTMCNPPFHSSLKQSKAGTDRKWKNLGKEEGKTVLNFGGQNNELCCDGGEVQFVSRMIAESAAFAKSVLWFTTLISQKDSLAKCYRVLEKVRALDVRTINMSQGQKRSRILAWTFLDKTEQDLWRDNRS